MVTFRSRDSYLSGHTFESSSSSQPILNDNRLGQSTGMSDNGKAPVNGTSAHNVSRSPDDPLVKVQPPRREDLQPSYARVIKPDDADSDTHGWYGSMVNTLGGCIGTLGAIPCCIVCPNPYRQVQQGNVGLVVKFGRFSRAVDPGLVYINPLSENVIQVDVKIQIVGMYLRLFGCGTQNLTTLQRFPSKYA